MKKVYNSRLIYNFCDKAQKGQVQCMPEDIYNKTFWKKINLNNIENVGLIFAYTDNKKELMQKFFPNKYAEISARGDFEITHFVYSKTDNKIHCIVNQDGENVSLRPIEGTMHLKTSGETINPLFSGEIPVEAITQNLASFIEE